MFNKHRGRQPTVRGPIRLAKQNHPARCPFTNCSNCMVRLVVLYIMKLPSLQLLLLHTYEELRVRNRTVLQTGLGSPELYLEPELKLKIRSRSSFV